ncbi:MAG: alginate lyase family protein [Phycisphaerae bacterium]
MTRLQKAYYVLRHLGPGFVLQRVGMAVANKLGTSRRTYRPREWGEIELREILSPGLPADDAGYARFKRDTAPPFLFPFGQPPTIPASIREAPTERTPALRERLELARRMRPVYLFHWPSPEPIDWSANALQQTRCERGRSWFEYPDFLAAQGDARTFWDPGRAAWAIDLARARSHGVDIPANEVFWRWFDSFMTACPPYRGFHWKCGQESSVRFIALAIAFWALADDSATTPERFTQFARLAWATGYRVFHHIDYAVSQKNNHAISEACGLIVVSHLFPEFRESPRWQATGRRVLEQEVRRQFYSDGSYIQHSMNYQRVALHGVLLSLRLAELAGKPLNRDLYDALGRAAEFLFQMMEPATGRLPQYGNNDGANVLPLSECDFNDFRPAIQAAHFLATRRKLLPPGAWDEELLWLCGADALEAPHETARRPARSTAALGGATRSDSGGAACPDYVAPVSSAFDAGGYYTLRGGESWAMIRCHAYRDRPAHVDPLHVDLWWRGLNVLRDCGTFRYYTPENPRVEMYFKSIAAHNTVEIDNAEPLELASRFLWFPWPAATRRAFEPSRNRQGAGISETPAPRTPPLPDGRGSDRAHSYSGAARLYFEGEHAAYDRAPWRVLHRRAVIGLAGEVWIVVDDLLGAGEHAATLRWHMLDGATTLDQDKGHLTLQTPAGDVHLSLTASSPLALSLSRGVDTPQRVQGWESPYYGERRTIPVLEATCRAALPMRMITVFSPLAPLIPCLTQDTPVEQLLTLVGDAGERQLSLCLSGRTARSILE